MGVGFPKRSCSDKRIERDDDSKKSHPALGIRQLDQDGFRLTVSQDPMASVEFKNCSTVRTRADLSDFLRVDINDDLIRLEASIGNAAMRMALRRSPDA